MERDSQSESRDFNSMLESISNMTQQRNRLLEINYKLQDRFDLIKEAIEKMASECDAKAKAFRSDQLRAWSQVLAAKHGGRAETFENMSNDLRQMSKDIDAKINEDIEEGAAAADEKEENQQ